MAEKQLKVMVVAAHPQDPFERAGGTVAKHLARGDRAKLVALTTGVVTHAFGVFPLVGGDKLMDVEKVRAAKRAEFERGAKALGVAEWEILDFNESPLIVGLPEYIKLVNVIRDFRPDIVLTSHPVEVGRQDHMDCGRMTLAAVDYARADGFPSPLAPCVVPNLFMFYYPDFRSDQLMASARHMPEVVVDISTVVEKKKAAMMEFMTTQAKAGEDYLKTMNLFMASVDGAVGYRNGCAYAEEFSRWNAERVQYLPLA